MQARIVLLGFVFCLFGCNNLVKSKTERYGEPDVFNVASNDNNMNNAIKLAKTTFEEFEVAYDSTNSDFEFFAIKQAFPHESGNEHIWVGNLSKRNDSYFGTIDNMPVNNIGLKLGDTVEINKEWISDWIYYENMKVRGGYTIRAIRNSLSVEEKKIFDFENGLFFDDE